MGIRTAIQGEGQVKRKWKERGFRILGKHQTCCAQMPFSHRRVAAEIDGNCLNKPSEFVQAFGHTPNHKHMECVGPMLNDCATATPCQSGVVSPQSWMLSMILASFTKVQLSRSVFTPTVYLSCMIHTLRTWVFS